MTTLAATYYAYCDSILIAVRGNGPGNKAGTSCQTYIFGDLEGLMFHEMGSRSGLAQIFNGLTIHFVLRLALDPYAVNGGITFQLFTIRVFPNYLGCSIVCTSCS